MTVVLRELLGDSTKLSVLEELIERWGEPLTVDEIARISEVPLLVAHDHLRELEAIGIVTESNGKYRLKKRDERAKALRTLENEEYVRIVLNSLEEPEIKN